MSFRSQTRGSPAAANGKRRPGRRPSGQSLGVDHHRSARARRSEATARVPAGCWAATSTGADKVGTLHDMRFVFLDNDTKLLFATAYDGDWDAYIDDFVTKIPDYLDLIDSAWEGWPGIRSPGAKTTSSSTRSRLKAGTSPIRI